jgi:hypothetical protein
MRTFNMVAALDDLLAELRARDCRYAKPDIEQAPWGERSLSVRDPFGNRLTFFERVE